MNRFQIQAGFVLILLSLLTGLGMPIFINPRLGLAAHTVGIIGGLVVIALGALASSFNLGRRASAVMMWSWLYAAYANWLGSFIGALTGASRLTPIAGAGTSGTPLAEAIVSFLFTSLAVVSIIATSIAIWGFRKERRGVATSLQAHVATPPA